MNHGSATALSELPLPFGWRVFKTKNLCRGGPAYGANIPADVYTNDGVRFIRTTDIDDAGQLSAEGVNVPENLPEERLNDGDLLLSRSGTIGRSFLYNAKLHGPCFYAGYLVRFRPHDNPTARFLFWATKSALFLAQLTSDAIESTISNFNGQKYANVYIPCPDDVLYRSEIADFLDRETAKIDALIAKQTEFLAKLDEHHRALVTKALIRGLDPSVPMQETGIEGLERVPQSWNVVRLKTVLNHIGQGWSPQCENRPAEDDEWGVLKVGCVNGMYFDANENKALPSTLEPIPNLEIHSGDVLMSRANTIELVGSISIVEEVRPKLMLCDKLYRLRLKVDRADSRFIVHCLISPMGRGPLEAAATGASPSMKNISQDAVKNIWLALPALAEQRKIADFIDERNASLERARRTAISMIERLKERRSALITAAVTGQIDVTDPALTKAAA